MQARLKAGWVSEADLAPPPPPETAEADARGAGLTEHAHRMIAQAEGAPAEETDRGPHGRERERLCAVTRTVQPVSEMIRFVVGPSGEAVADLKSKLPGRGIWVTATREALGERSSAKFSRAGSSGRCACRPTSSSVSSNCCCAPSSTPWPSPARPVWSPQASPGPKPRSRTARFWRLLHAAEASPQGMRKLAAAWRRQQEEAPALVVGFLTSAQLDLALNRPNVVHAALLAGPASETFLARCRRLERFRTGDQHPEAVVAAPNSTRRGL